MYSCAFTLISRLADRPGKGRNPPSRGRRGLRLLVAVVAFATTTTAIAALRLTIGAFASPHFYFIFFCTLDASLAHLNVVFNFSFRKLAVFPEDDVETQTEYAKSDQDKCC